MKNEKNILRWGGLAGILAFIVWIVELPLYGYVDPFSLEGLMMFPDKIVALGMSTILTMAYAFLSVALVLALYRALRGTGMAPALFGTVLSVIGYIGTALGDASTFFAFAPLSDLYHASEATSETQATVSLLWETTMGLTSTFFFVESLFLMIGFIVLGLAMFGAPTFGRRSGAVSIVLGLIGVIGVVASLFVSGIIGLQLIGVSTFANLIFLPIFGWKVYRLSRTE